MARKGLLEGLMPGRAADGAAGGDPAPARPADAAPDAWTGARPDARPDARVAAPAGAGRRGTGAIGAVGRSFEQMRANAVREVPADMIDGAGLPDRIGPDDDLARLAASIREYGQQVPVLLRHSPNAEGRYDVVYGRRRVAALRALGRPVRAMIRDLPDRDLIVAQGQENAARRDLSFVEKARFAHRMAAMGFERKVICDALHVDKTQVSKMIQVADGVPDALIRAIGPAPATGRDRWVALARALPGREAAALAAAEGATEGATGGAVDSDRRFAAALAAATERARAPAPSAAPSAARSAAWGRARRGTRGTTIQVSRKSDAFAEWLLARMDGLHAEWAAGQQRNPTEED
jgi:ParB family chromosome partitioning protein